MTPSDDDPGNVYPEEFIGWRGWVVEGGILHSVNGGEVWTPRTEFQAECSLGKTHKHVPEARCQCGIYSTKTLKKLRSNGYHTAGVFGTISLWGNIIDGGDGYRSEFAYPRIIYVPFLSWKMVDALKEYGVPVKLLNPFTGEVV